MPRWLKITLGVVAGLIVLLLLNALVVSNTTKDAYIRDQGATLVDTSTGRLQVLDQGDPKGSPIVLLHCATCSMDWWDRLAPLLGQDHRVIRIDLLGMGGSDKPGSGYSITDQASGVAEALAKLHVVGATVVGHSLGGTVATALAEQSPSLASRIVIIDQSPEDGFEHESLGEHLSLAPVIGQAIARLIQVAPKSLIRDQYDQAFAPGYDISSGFDNPDQPVDDLRAMTYTALKDTVDAEQDYVDRESAGPAPGRHAPAAAGDLRRRGPDLRPPGGHRALPAGTRRADPSDPGRRPLSQRREARSGRAADPGVRDAAAAGEGTAEEAKGRWSAREGLAEAGEEIAKGPGCPGPS